MFFFVKLDPTTKKDSIILVICSSRVISISSSTNDAGKKRDAIRDQDQGWHLFEITCLGLFLIPFRDTARRPGGSYFFHFLIDHSEIFL